MNLWPFHKHVWKKYGKAMFYPPMYGARVPVYMYEKAFYGWTWQPVKCECGKTKAFEYLGDMRG